MLDVEKRTGFRGPEGVINNITVTMSTTVVIPLVAVAPTTIERYSMVEEVTATTDHGDLVYITGGPSEPDRYLPIFIGRKMVSRKIVVGYYDNVLKDIFIAPDITCFLEGVIDPVNFELPITISRIGGSGDTSVTQVLNSTEGLKNRVHNTFELPVALPTTKSVMMRLSNGIRTTDSMKEFGITTGNIMVNETHNMPSEWLVLDSSLVMFPLETTGVCVWTVAPVSSATMTMNYIGRQRVGLLMIPLGQ